MKKKQAVRKRSLSHVDGRGAARMVDVSGKRATDRRASARAVLRMRAETVRLIEENRLAKGDVFAVARLAGIAAAKRTADLIPLCHTLGLESITVELKKMSLERIEILTEARLIGKTGVEMEAMTAAAVAALALYDMVKSVDRGVEIEGIRLEEKSGGRSGHWRRESAGR